MDYYKVKKKTSTRFVVDELVVFCSQIFIFFIVAIFTSSMLSDQPALEAYAFSKLNNGSLSELLFTFIAISCVVGIFTFIERSTNSEIVKDSMENILHELPRAIYFFGSSASGVMFAILAHMVVEPNPGYSIPGVFVITTLFFLVAFTYGCCLSYLLIRKTHITQ